MPDQTYIFRQRPKYATLVEFAHQSTKVCSNSTSQLHEGAECD